MLQIRPKGTNDPFYGPHRDLAYLFPHIAYAAMQGLDAGAWQPWYKEWLNHNGVTEEQLGEGARVLALFCKCCTAKIDEHSAEDVLERVGFFDLPRPVQFVIQAKLGQIMLGAFFASIREVTYLGEQPPIDLKAITDAGKRAAHYMSMGRVRRSMTRRWHSFKRWMAGKLGNKADNDEPKLPKGPPPTYQGSATATVGTEVTEEQPKLPERLPLPGASPDDAIS